MDLEEVIIMGEERESGTGDGTSSVLAERSPLAKTRSLSDGGGTPGRKLSPSPLILESHRRTSKDDSSIGDNSTGTPVTPRRPDFHLRGLSLQLPPSDLSPAAAQQYRPAPLSPKLDQSQIYASPTNILPRRSRGLDFSRAATSLHHSTLAEQQSPDSSPTVGGRGMNIPGRRPGEFGAAETTNSLWSMMGNQEKMHISSSLGSGHNVCSDSSSTSDEDDFMDDDMMDEGFVTTPQVSKTSQLPGVPWSGSPAMNSLLSFQQRQRPRKQPKKKARGPLGLGFHSISGGPPNLNLSKSPPNNLARESAHARRESISWAANQLHISGNESDDNLRSQMEMGDGLPGTPSRDNPRGVVRRVVTRRGNLLPKTKGFARIRAALMEEGAPVESEFKREAEVIRQVRESDMDLEPRIPPPSMSQPTTTNSSPTLAPQDPPEDVPDDAMLMDSVAGGLGLSSFKRQAVKNSKGKVFWDTFSESSSNGGGTAPGRTTPPPTASLARGSSAGMSVDDMSMDSPSTCSGPVNSTMNSLASNGIFPMAASTRSSSGHDTPQPGFGPSLTQLQQQQQQQQQQVPTAAEITRRINTKRRRGDDDLDPVSFKRRAVSPGMSVHNSPIMQSPLQRDLAPWGGGAGGPGSSRPGSNGADRPGGSSSGTQSENGRGGGGGGGGKGRVGFQGMVDTNDGITKLSIE